MIPITQAGMANLQDWEFGTSTPVAVRLAIRRWIANELMAEPEQSLDDAIMIPLGTEHGVQHVPALWIDDVLVTFDVLGSDEPETAHLYTFDSLYDLRI